QERGCGATLPPLSEVVPGWQGAQNAAHGAAIGGEGGHGEALDGDAGGINVPLHRRKIVRSRAAPAGPHPYLDRFASGMHRPLEGDDASWRGASIQPVPIPDLGHTGIRTKFSSGAGNGFAPDGAMTNTFRSGIHDTVRNLAPPSRKDARDMKARDYARATRRHRVDPCGGSLLHAHISSLGNFRSRFSPPSSPLSTRRALAGYGLCKKSGGGGFAKGDGGGRDSRATTPADGRQALLMRELSSVRLAAAGMAGGVFAGDGGSAGDGFGARHPADSRSAGCSLKGQGRSGIRKGGGRGMRRYESIDHCRLQGPREGGAENDWESYGGGEGNDGLDPENGELDFDQKLEKVGEGRRGDGGYGSASRGTGTPRAGGSDADEAAWRANRRGRGKRRGVPTEEGTRRRYSHHAPRTASDEALPREAVRHLKKPFSSASLLACLLDVRFGNTRDLSPEKAPGQKWDLGALPAGIAPATAGGWDGFYESDGEGCGGDGEGVVGGACGKEPPRSAASEYRSGSSGGGDANGADFAVVRGGCRGEAGGVG
ncbi:unnamed protein product, partial [Scytosiphon promiscuus]